MYEGNRYFEKVNSGAGLNLGESENIPYHTGKGWNS